VADGQSAPVTGFTQRANGMPTHTAALIGHIPGRVQQENAATTPIDSDRADHDLAADLPQRPSTTDLPQMVRRRSAVRFCNGARSR
jgi:hypothetical protein